MACFFTAVIYVVLRLCAFLQGYVEMSSAEEADKLVEHYSTNSLKIKGKTINVCSSTEYQTLE